MIDESFMNTVLSKEECRLRYILASIQYLAASNKGNKILIREKRINFIRMGNFTSEEVMHMQEEAKRLFEARKPADRMH